MLQKRWQHWRDVINGQQDMEAFAALVTIQSWLRVPIAKRIRSMHRVQYAATQLQSLWRGFHCRKMLTRRQRHRMYTHASRVIQRGFRAHVWRCEFQKFIREHRAACTITQSIKRYCLQRRLLRAWYHRLATFHATIVIQGWVRYQIAKLHRARARAKMHGSAVQMMQHFFKRAHFLLVFDRRVQRLLQQKTAAAMKLQAAYRAKLARSRFHALKDQLEERKRQEILRIMWENAYATTIQTWWRKVKKHRQLERKNLESSEIS
uniref:Uncharacterized protein n=1 Tax=Globisporangium ultimum (strain ATCC 200006 / CBS 805.95 / DAOM BR144) TaxID=431595 RepID=K3WGA7_GLOUD